MYLFQKNLLVKAIMNNCFSHNPVYVFKKRRFMRWENPKPFVFAKLEIGRKKTNIFE